MSLQWRVAGILLGVFAVVAMLAYADHYRQETKRLSLELQSAQATIAGRDLLLDKYRAQAQINAQVITDQQNSMSDITAASARRQSKIAALEAQNAELRRWADTQLPDAVRRMHNRPAIAGSAGFKSWLSSPDSMPSSGQ